MPADFVEKAGLFNKREAAQFWKAGETAITRWYKDTSIKPAGRKVNGLPPLPVPDDFAQYAHLNNSDLMARYGRSNVTIAKWRKAVGIMWDNRHLKPKAEPKPKTATMRVNAGWGYAKPVPISGRDDSTLGVAAEKLRRLGYVPVYRATIIDPKADRDLWVVGRRKLVSDELMALADKMAA
jgi:hypothetical protein